MSNSRHCFGSEKQVIRAVRAGTIAEYDLVCLNEGKIGWIDSDGQLVIAAGGTNVQSGAVKQFETRADFPTLGDDDSVYLSTSTNSMYIWDGEEYCLLLSSDELKNDLETVLNKAKSNEAAIAAMAGTYEGSPDSELLQARADSKGVTHESLFKRINQEVEYWNDTISTSNEVAEYLTASSAQN